MIQPKKEMVEKTYREKDIVVKTMKQFQYSSEQEKLKHKILMEKDGYTDSGQTRENIGTVAIPDYVWFGSYYKYEFVEEN